MERDTPVRVRLDRLADDEATTLSWPPRDLVAHPEVVDLETPQFAFDAEAAPAAQRGPSVGEAEFPRPVPGAASHRHGESAGGGEVRARGRTSRAVRIAIAALAALALVEGIVIVLQFTGNNAVRQFTAGARERMGLTNAEVPVASATRPNTPAPAASVAATAAAAPAGAVAGGQLQVQTDPAGATVIVDGLRRGTAPMTVQGLAPGAHRVRLVAGDRSIEQTVTVQPNVVTALVMPLARGAAAGWVDFVMPFEAQIFEQGRLVGTSAQPRLQFGAGEHRFELVNDTLGYRAIEVVRVKPGEVAEVRPAIPTGRLSINATPWAEVWIDGRESGTTPLGNVPVPIGTREVRFRHPELGEQTRRVLVTTTEPARVSLDFRP